MSIPEFGAAEHLDLLALVTAAIGHDYPAVTQILYGMTDQERTIMLIIAVGELAGSIGGDPDPGHTLDVWRDTINEKRP